MSVLLPGHHTTHRTCVQLTGLLPQTGEEVPGMQSISAEVRPIWVPLNATAHPVRKMLLGQAQGDGE